MTRHHIEPVVLLPGPDRFTSDALRAAVERPPAHVEAKRRWTESLERLRARGYDPAEVERRVMENLAHWKANPAPWSNEEALAAVCALEDDKDTE